MNISELTYLISNPNAIGDKHTFVLEKITDEFPYFQSARALKLKGLHNQDSFKYNNELKLTAAHTTDRSVLFEFITSENFMAIQKAFFDEKEAMIRNIKVNDSEIVYFEREIKVNSLEQSILTSIKESQTNNETLEIEEKLEIGKPLDFSKEEKHSFQEWLQLASFNPISRIETKTDLEINVGNKEIDIEKQKKIDMIDKFIQTNPKIAPVKNNTPIAVVSERNAQDNSYLMTETLAKVYLEQKKYQKAIQAYEILILKYPEKSHFFADRILDIKLLQQNNNN